MRGVSKKWSEMSGGQKAFVLTAAGAELALTTVAAVDLIRRPSARVRGRKGLWALSLAVQPVGPIAYLWVHRHV